MSKDRILTILPYIFIYFLIFKDPYSIIIPVSEPKLIYSPETTWLLHDSTKETNFSHAYNQHFSSILHDSNNAFPYFITALNSPEFSPATKETFNSFQALGENDQLIPMSIGFGKIKELSKNKLRYRDLFKESMILKNRPIIIRIIKKINLPDHIIRYEAPLLSNLLDQIQFNLRLSQYIKNLVFFADNEDRTKKALFQLRLLTNTSDQYLLKIVIESYKKIVHHKSISIEKIKKLELDLPPWPNIKTLITRMQRGKVTKFITNQSQGLEIYINNFRKKNKDFFLDKNAALLYIRNYYTKLESKIPNKTMDMISKEKRKFLELVFLTELMDGKKRTLADIMLFSGSIKDQHKRDGILFGRRICLVQSYLLMKAVEDVSKIYEPITKAEKDEQ